MNNAAVEFEIKAALQSAGEADDLLRSLRLSKKTSNTDIYFDTDQRQLFVRGVFLRLRDGETFEIKHNPDMADVSHVSCNEHKFSWPIRDSERDSVADFLRQFLRPVNANGTGDVLADYDLKQFVKIVKHRAVYDAPELEVCVDEIDGLGAFLEVEAKSERGKTFVEDFCAKHRLKNIPLGYVELWLRKNDFDTYLKGRYKLENDKPPYEGMADAITA